jgi:glutamate N-acetyltransferase / amino-acid N-acetyltransferase
VWVRCQPAGFESEYFSMESAPLLIPEGPWTEVEGSVLAPAGFTANGMYSKMRAGAKGDLALLLCAEGAVAAGAFTQNVMCAAPVTVCKEVLAKNSRSIKAVRSLVIAFRYTTLFEFEA